PTLLISPHFPYTTLFRSHFVQDDNARNVDRNKRMTARERVKQLINAWPKVYPNAHCELDFRNPLELLVATILSAQCTDKRVNMVDRKSTRLNSSHQIISY